MGISNPFKKSEELKEKIEFPDVDEEILDKEEENVIEFVKKRSIEKKEAEKKALEAKQKPQKAEPTPVPVEKPIQAPFEEPKEPVKEEKPAPESYLAHEMSLYLDKSNVAAGFAVIEEALGADFSLAIQAGVMINQENVAEIKKLVPWLAEHGYLVVVSGQKTERVLNE